MDTEIQRMPAPKQIWQHINGAYYFVIAIANTEHRHDDHPPQVIYRSMRQDNGEPSHWWTRNLADWHAKMCYVAEFVPAKGLTNTYRLWPERDSQCPHSIAQDPPPPPEDVCPATGGKHLVRIDRTVRGGYGCIRCGEPR